MEFKDKVEWQRIKIKNRLSKEFVIKWLNEHPEDYKFLIHHIYKYELISSYLYNIIIIILLSFLYVEINYKNVIYL